jgi:hypothetical protein
MCGAVEREVDAASIKCKHGLKRITRSKTTTFLKTAVFGAKRGIIETEEQSLFWFALMRK